MKDLIAKLHMDANCALGAIWMHIDAQAARIAELEAQIAAKSAPVVEQQPVAWSYECQQNAEGTVWSEFINRTKPKLTERDGVRNIKPLYAAPQTADTDKLREAIANISNNQITEAWESCGGVDGFYKSFGYQQFAHAILDLAADTVASTALQAPVREVPETWIPISDKLPEISEMVWCLRTDGRVLMASRKTYAPIAKREPWQDCYWWDCKHGANWSDVTVVAWSHITVPSAPLPAAPVQQEPKP